MSKENKLDKICNIKSSICMNIFIIVSFVFIVISLYSHKTLEIILNSKNEWNTSVNYGSIQVIEYYTPSKNIEDIGSNSRLYGILD